MEDRPREHLVLDDAGSTSKVDFDGALPAGGALVALAGEVDRGSPETRRRELVLALSPGPDDGVPASPRWSSAPC